MNAGSSRNKPSPAVPNHTSLARSGEAAPLMICALRSGRSLCWVRNNSDGCVRNVGNCVYRSFSVRGRLSVLATGGRGNGVAMPTREMRVHSPPARTMASPVAPPAALVAPRSNAMRSGTPVMTVRCSCSVSGRYIITPPGTPSHSASSTGSPASTVIC